MTPDEADKKQAWAGMDGAIAFHLIERHADDWDETGKMMEAWRRANSPAWHDEPTCVGVWVCDDAVPEDPQHWWLRDCDRVPLPALVLTKGARWYGPIPEDDGGKP